MNLTPVDVEKEPHLKNMFERIRIKQAIRMLPKPAPMLPKQCNFFVKNGHCKFGDQCKYQHPQLEHQALHPDQVSPKKAPLKPRKAKNTECFVPRQEPCDMRLVYDLGSEKKTTALTTRDVLLVPNLFKDYAPGEIYTTLMSEINDCPIPPNDLFKMWHGNDKIEGTHLIVNDKVKGNWKQQCPTFQMVIKRLADFFDMQVKATRFNIYKDTSQWKPFHHDSAYINPEKAKTQNITVAVSFGETRDAAFEHAKTKTTISIPQGDGVVYTFSNDTNIIWRHGILQETPTRESGRISIICWSWIKELDVESSIV